MTQDAGIRVEVTLSPQVEAAFAAGWQPQFGADIMQAIEDGIVQSGHYGVEYRKREPGWKPLTPKWIKRKEAMGADLSKWKMKGHTYSALTTRANITVGGGQVVGRRVVFLENNSKRVRAEWELQEPCARIGARAVWHNNKLREWLTEIMPGSLTYSRVKARCEVAIKKIGAVLLTGAK